MEKIEELYPSPESPNRFSFCNGFVTTLQRKAFKKGARCQLAKKGLVSLKDVLRILDVHYIGNTPTELLEQLKTLNDNEANI